MKTLAEKIKKRGASDSPLSSVAKLGCASPQAELDLDAHLALLSLSPATTASVDTTQSGAGHCHY